MNTVYSFFIETFNFSHTVFLHSFHYINSRYLMFWDVIVSGMDFISFAIVANI